MRTILDWQGHLIGVLTLIHTLELYKASGFSIVLTRVQRRLYSEILQRLRVGEQLAHEAPREFCRVIQRRSAFAAEQIHRGQEVVRATTTLKYDSIDC